MLRPAYQRSARSADSPRTVRGHAVSAFAVTLRSVRKGNTAVICGHGQESKYYLRSQTFAVTETAVADSRGHPNPVTSDTSWLRIDRMSNMVVAITSTQDWNFWIFLSQMDKVSWYTNSLSEVCSQTKLCVCIDDNKDYNGYIWNNASYLCHPHSYLSIIKVIKIHIFLATSIIPNAIIKQWLSHYTSLKCECLFTRVKTWVW